MEDHDLFFVCSFILGSTVFFTDTIRCARKWQTKKHPIYQYIYATPLQFIRRDALDERHHAAISRRPNMSQARDDLVHRLLGSGVGLDDYDLDNNRTCRK